MAPRSKGLIIVFPGAYLENSKASMSKLKRVILGQNDIVSNKHCFSSSSSYATNSPKKKGNKLWNVGIPVQPKHKLQILSSWRLPIPELKIFIETVQWNQSQEHDRKNKKKGTNS
jgi:hypothetical protein